MFSWVVRLFGKKTVWPVDAQGRSVCWVCGISMDDDWTRFIDEKRGSYCMRHEGTVNNMHRLGILK